ncbi:MAG: hypothetical protein ACR2KB_01215 [Chitinophagaceae bacterium]
MYKVFHFFANRFLSLSRNRFAAGHAKAKVSDNTVIETAKIISLQHYIVFNSIDVINREEDTTDIQRDAIIISF